jgi:hypothetical protein
MHGIRHNFKTLTVMILVLSCGAPTSMGQPAGHVGTGILEATGDVGVTPKPGSVVYDAGE